MLASADRALAIAVEHGDVALEARALADGGLALVSQGRTREGFARLEAAQADFAALAGKTVTPGLTDAHCHLYGLGVDLESVSVRALASEAALLRGPTLEEVLQNDPGRAAILPFLRMQPVFANQEAPHKFGYGVIAEIEGNKLEIDFEVAGRKRVMDSFVSVGD